MESLKQSQAARRKAHFANGGDSRTWTPIGKKLDDSRSKARRSKNACRSWNEKDE
jgi:hypothetical protein